MSIREWAMQFKYVMDVLVDFMRMSILPGTDITFMDVAIWGMIIFLVLKVFFSVLG